MEFLIVAKDALLRVVEVFLFGSAVGNFGGITMNIVEADSFFRKPCEFWFETVLEAGKIFVFLSSPCRFCQSDEARPGHEIATALCDCCFRPQARLDAAHLFFLALRELEIGWKSIDIVEWIDAIPVAPIFVTGVLQEIKVAGTAWA